MKLNFSAANHVPLPVPHEAVQHLVEEIDNVNVEDKENGFAA
jgi:hypothetical protein